MTQPQFPYYEGDNIPDRVKKYFQGKTPKFLMCPLSGRGYIHCTSSIRARKKICKGCYINPDTPDDPSFFEKINQEVSS